MDDSEVALVDQSASEVPLVCIASYKRPNVRFSTLTVFSDNRDTQHTLIQSHRQIVWKAVS